MPREEQDQAEEQPLHGSDDGDRNDALVAIQDAMRQISARVEALTAAQPAGSAARGRARPITPPLGRMPAQWRPPAAKRASRWSTSLSLAAFIA